MPVTYFRDFLRDIAERTETAMPQRQVFAVCRLALQAQAQRDPLHGAASVIGMAVIGLGNALQPHARGLVDLADRVRVVWAAARSQARLQDAADRYGFPTTTDIARAIADPRGRCGADADAGQRPSADRGGRIRRRQARAVREAAGGCRRTRPSVWSRQDAGRTVDLGICLQHRFRAGSQRLHAGAGRGCAGQHPGRNDDGPVVATTEPITTNRVVA